MSSEAAKKAWETIRKRKLLGLPTLSSRRKSLKRKLNGPITAKIGPFTGMSGTPIQPPGPPPSRGSQAAKKAWETRRKNEAEAEKEEAENAEALRILDEMIANRPPAPEAT